MFSHRVSSPSSSIVTEPARRPSLSKSESTYEEFVLLKDDFVTEEVIKIKTKEEFRKNIKSEIDNPNHNPLAKYAFCLIDAIFIGDITQAVAAATHLSMGVARQTGFNIPQIMHEVINHCVNVYQYSQKAVRYCKGKTSFIPTVRDPANFMASIEYMLGKSEYTPVMTGMRAAYTMYKGICALGHPALLLRWFLLTLRSELIARGQYPKLSEIPTMSRSKS